MYIRLGKFEGNVRFDIKIRLQEDILYSKAYAVQGNLPKAFNYAFLTSLPFSVNQPTALRLTSGISVAKSPGSKPDSLRLCERVHIHGLSRLHNLRKYANLVKVNVSVPYGGRKGRLLTTEVCFHRNMSLGLGMCPQWQWEKLIKGSWVRSMSPYDNMVLDIRMPGQTLEILEVSIEDEFLFLRIIFLVMGIVMLTLASTWSNSFVFYYGSSMTVGVILVILTLLFMAFGNSSTEIECLCSPNTKELPAMVISVAFCSFLYHIWSARNNLIFRRTKPNFAKKLNNSCAKTEARLFKRGSVRDSHAARTCAVVEGISMKFKQLHRKGMKALPRKNSFAIFMYSSFVGVGSFLLHYLPRLLLEIGIREDMHKPLFAFLLVCIVLVGAWLGFWVVNRHIIAEDGSIDSSISLFVAWSIRIFAAVMIVQSSLDWLLAGEALVGAVLVSLIMRRVAKPRFISRLYKHLFRKSAKSSHRRSNNGPTRTPPCRPSDSETFLSTFHNTSERKSLSREDWKDITRYFTKRGLEELFSSPDFNRWAMTNAERITLAPP
ncbi:hypothetical protein GIB67_018907 [Kingdonia uniflora]|uniref:Uncharacterized protein n=1 Tax=Kingdonia uniflora TaxID=39325 RepID=A0A7J7L2T9_9MAGN|nr:hypothetical protein GIB67_018907 [Kingdonia uniflora]